MKSTLAHRDDKRGAKEDAYALPKAVANHFAREPAAWHANEGDMAALPENLPFVIEEWSLVQRNRVRVIARADNVTVARGAFDAACAAFPNRWLRLRRRGLVVNERKPPQI